MCRLSFIPLFFQAGGNTEPVKGDDVLRVMTFNAHGFHGLDSDTMMRADSGADDGKDRRTAQQGQRQGSSAGVPFHSGR